MLSFLNCSDAQEFKHVLVCAIYFSEHVINKNEKRFLLKVALDGGTRPGDTLQILPLALAQPPNPRSITSHSVLRGHPSLTHRVVFFRGIQWGIHSRKIIIGTAIFFKKICISDEKHEIRTLDIYKFIVLIMCNYNVCIFIYIYVNIILYPSYAYICECA